MKCLASVIAIAFAFVFPVQVKADCGPGDIDYKAAYPDAWAQAEAKSDAALNADGVLWKVSKPGIPASYLFGTMHTGDVNATPAGRAAIEQLRQQRVAFFELGAGKDAEMQAAITEDPSLIIAQRPAPLSEWLSDPLTARLTERAAALGLPEQALPVLKPGMLFAMISVPPCAIQAATARGGAMDEQLRQAADTAGVPNIGLETWRDQLGLFIDAPLEEQRNLLRLSLATDSDPEAVYQLNNMLYRQGRIQMIWEVSIAIGAALSPNSNVHDAGVDIWNDLIVERNRGMVAGAAPTLAEGGAMIIVGALHLPTKDGLVALIRGLGYTVENVM